jgi:hypothetical protein
MDEYCCSVVCIHEMVFCQRPAPAVGRTPPRKRPFLFLKMRIHPRRILKCMVRFCGGVAAVLGGNPTKKNAPCFSDSAGVSAHFQKEERAFSWWGSANGRGGAAQTQKERNVSTLIQFPEFDKCQAGQ